MIEFLIKHYCQRDVRLIAAAILWGFSTVSVMAEAQSDGATASPGFSAFRYINLDKSKWPASPEGEQHRFTEYYTRLEVEADGPTKAGGLLRDYEGDRRTAIARFFSGKAANVIATSDIELQDPELKTSVPLFSIAHTSDRGKGENFVTDLTSSHVTAPLFRIGPNTTLTLHLHIDASEKAKFDATPVIFKAVQTAVSLASPPAGILTSFSKSDLSKRAQAIDTALSGLLSQDIVENGEVGRLLGNWSPGQYVLVTLHAPGWSIKDQSESKSAPRNDELLETWKIGLSCPRPSIFSTADVCTYKNGHVSLDPKLYQTLPASIASDVNPHAILDTNLSSQVTIKSYIQSQTWYTDFLQVAFTKPVAGSKGDPSAKLTDPYSKDSPEGKVRSFCSQLLTGLYDQGLNHLDAALTLRAVSFAMPGIAGMDKAKQLNDYCASLVQDEPVTSKKSQEVKGVKSDVITFSTPLVSLISSKPVEPD